MFQHLVKCLDERPQLHLFMMRLNGKCQVILLSILPSYCEAAVLLHGAHFLLRAAHHVNPTETYSHISTDFTLLIGEHKSIFTIKHLESSPASPYNGKKKTALLHWIPQQLMSFGFRFLPLKVKRDDSHGHMYCTYIYNIYIHNICHSMQLPYNP